VTLIRPFAGLRVRADAAARVSSPPYDVMNSEEAARMAAGNPDSFLHVSRPEIDLPSGTDVHADAVYAQAAKALADLEQRGLLQREATPHLYLYRLTMDGRPQTGIAAAFSVDAYREGRIKRHEFTRPDKEDDRTRHVDTTSANSGPVFLAFRADAELKARLRAIEAQPPVIDITTDDGIRHELWPVGDDGEIAALVAGVERAGALYIADGHHRCAAAGRVADLRRERNPGYTGDEAFNFGYAVCFPHDELRIFDYNRFVRDLAGRTPEAFLAEIGGAFDVAPAGAAVRPACRGEFGMHLGGRWYRLTVKPALVPVGDPVRSLDVSVLQDNLLGPVLGIADPRRDARIDFVGGIRGLGELERRVADVPGSVAFSMYPTSLEEVMAVADAGEVMPPKSTWFEPKLRDGLLVQTI
jgi:uncharacterized protein (DUF1015 family)